MQKKLWEKGTRLNSEAEKYAVGNEHMIDLKLVKYDCMASMAHARMLERAGILTAKEAKSLVKGMKQIMKLHEKGKFRILREQEDCHTAIENYLTAKIGKAGRKIHTARSRNDQVIAALRLYEKEELAKTKRLVLELAAAIGEFSMKHWRVQMPGYTHLRKAMPYSVGKWAESYKESLQDDLILIEAALKLIDQNPLGSAAGYGVPEIKIDRKMTAKLLNFSKIQHNTLYVQNSRGKFELAIIDALNHTMLDVNKLATDIWLFSTEEFGYFQLAPEISFGSSIMPQKANPDLLETLRAKASAVKGERDKVNNMIMNLPSGYNGDYKLTKEALINAIETTKESLKMAKLAIEKINVDAERCKEAMTPELYATEKAMKLVKKGVPFRDAYRKVADEMLKQKL